LTQKLNLGSSPQDNQLSKHLRDFNKATHEAREPTV